MFWFITAALFFAAFFIIVLPGAVLVAALLLNLRRSPAVETRLCLAADVTDPASQPCFAIDGAGYCQRHHPLEQAS